MIYQQAFDIKQHDTSILGKLKNKVNISIGKGSKMLITKGPRVLLKVISSILPNQGVTMELFFRHVHNKRDVDEKYFNIQIHILMCIYIYINEYQILKVKMYFKNRKNDGIYIKFQLIYLGCYQFYFCYHECTLLLTKKKTIQ